MNAYLSVLQQLVIDTAIRGGAQLSSEVKTGLGLRALSGFFVGLGLIFLCVASYLWLDSLFATHIAALIMGGLSLILGAVCLLVLRQRSLRREREILALRHDVEDKVRLALEIASEEFGDTIKDNPKSALLIAGLAGMLTTRYIR